MQLGVVGGQLLPRLGPAGTTLRELGVRDNTMVRVVSPSGPSLRWSKEVISSLLLGCSLGCFFVLGCALLAWIISAQMVPAARAVAANSLVPAARAAADSLVPAARAVAADSLRTAPAFFSAATLYLQVAGLGLAAPVAIPIIQRVPCWIGVVCGWLASFWR